MTCISPDETSLHFSQLNNILFATDLKTAVFWLAGFATLVLILYLALSLIERDALKKKEMDMENRFRERAQTLHVQMEMLRQRESVLRRSAILHTIAITSISHDIKSPVQFIVKSAKEIESLIDQNQLERLAKAGQIIGYTGDRIAHLIDEMSEFFKTSVDEKLIQSEEFSLADLVHRKIQTFSPIVATHGGQITIDLTAADRVVTNSKLLGILIHNIVDNAIKAKPANKIRIYTSELETELHLIIADEGPGFPASVLASLNGQETNADIPARDIENGWGVVIIKEICKLLHLRLYAYNTKGANVHIIFGLGKYSKWDRQPA